MPIFKVDTYSNIWDKPFEEENIRSNHVVQTKYLKTDYYYIDRTGHFHKGKKEEAPAKVVP